ncbi:copper transporter 5-like [Silene latifolia]|uniref:copper transporter 5-like n=1 Tax=Silene latifolia TaxID=37657 RepID=UPI003D770CF6
MMHMTLYWGTKVTLLFDFWKTESILSYTITLLACFLFAVFYQYMEDRRLSFLAMGITRQSQPSISTPFVPKPGARVSRSARFATAVLTVVNTTIAYMLMLGVMSFNGGVLIAVVVGFGVGYYLFRAKEYEALIVEDACACS